LLISTIGTGPWQIALVVVLAMSTAILLDGGAVITMRSANSAVLVATLYIPAHSKGASRMIDALIGGLVALAIAVVLPANPLNLLRPQAGRVLECIANARRAAAEAIRERDAYLAAEVLKQTQDSPSFLDDFKTALKAAEEIAAISPIRWNCRSQLKRYVRLAQPIEDALRNTKVLIRRTVAALLHDEKLSGGVHHAIAKLADAVDLLSIELAQGRDPAAARNDMRNVAASAGLDLIGDGGLSSRVVLAQLRSITVDLLQATGIARDQALAALQGEQLEEQAIAIVQLQTTGAKQ
jgi:uncharacterized membrane protein YgaE (UPF0421/DUF939 family)